MHDKESKTSHTNKHEAEKSDPAEVFVVEEMDDVDAGAPGGAGTVLKPGNSETNPFVGLHAKGEAKIQ